MPFGRRRNKDSFFCYKRYPPRAPVDGWYRVSLLRDDYNAYDRTSFKKDDSYFGLYKHYFEMSNGIMLLKTTGDFGSPNLYRSKVQNTDTLHADKYRTNPGSYRCQLKFDYTTRTWERLDDNGYMLYPVEINAPSPSLASDIEPNMNSCSLGVCLNDPRFLVTITSKRHYTFNHSGQYSEFPKYGYIWLFAGETIDSI